MAQPGWYPDPGGRPGQFRYWDGSGWSASTSATPASTTSPGAPAGRRGPWLVVAVVVALTLVVWLLVRGGPGTQVREDTNSSTPTVSAWDETSSASASPPEGTGGVPVECPDHQGDSRDAPGPRDGRYVGGGLSYAEIPGWEARAGWGVDWAHERDGQWDRVTDRWVAIAVVGQVDREEFPDPRTAAGQLMSCLASSYYYRDLTGRTDRESVAVTINGRSGWKLVSEIRVANHPEVQGDVITVIAVDVAREATWGIFVSEAPIGDRDRLAKVARAAESLRVEG